ncbi:MAG: helix-turn-helix domain-containing protein [Candidatus Sungbacteria bacterium]|nr:helix-turn-helix domain-containing protein [Candidatus Sungbacteria bacterium]
MDELAVAPQCEPSELQVFIPEPEPKEPQTALGKLIHSQRQRLGLSIDELADRLGTSLQHLKLLELGETETTIRYSTIRKLAQELHLNTSAFSDFITKIGFEEKGAKSPLGCAIRSRRKELGLSMVDVAEALHVSYQFISQIELGMIGLTKNDTFLAKLAAVLQIGPEYLRGLRPRKGLKTTKKRPLEPDSLAAFVFSRRLELGLTQQEIAERAGINDTLICQIEAGKIHEPRSGIAFWRNLGAALECEIPQALVPPAVSRTDTHGRPQIGMRVKSTTALGKFLVERRMELRLTREAIAVQTGILPQHLLLIEKGDVAKPRDNTLAKLAGVLQCDVARLSELVPGFSRVPIGLYAEPRSEDLDRIKELAGIGPGDAARKGIQLLRRLLERQRDGFSLFLAKGGDLVELELLL